MLERMYGGTTLTRSDFEDLFLSFCERNGFPRPAVNTLIETAAGDFEVDIAWPDARVVVELDGHETHGTIAAFERDRARDRALSASGWRVVRVTWRQLTGERRLAEELVAIRRAGMDAA